MNNHDECFGSLHLEFVSLSLFLSSKIKGWDGMDVTH